MIKLVIFDMDGLLIDSERAMWVPNEISTLDELGYEKDMDFLLSLMGGSKKTGTPKFLEKYGNDFDVDKFYEILVKKNETCVEKGLVPLRDGALEIIKYLEDHKIDFCLGTSSKKDYVYKILDSNKVLHRFKKIITGDDVTIQKPAPDIYLKCLSLYNYEKDECLVLEDAHNGALAANSAGIRCVIVKDLALLNTWDYENCKVVNSLKEVIDIIKEENERTSSL